MTKTKKELREEIRELVMKWRYDDGYIHHEDLINDLEILFDQALKQQREEILKALEMKEKPMSKHFRVTNKIELTRDKVNSGFNQAVRELNAKIKEIGGRR